MSVLRLAIPSPLRRLFDYLPPQGASSAKVESLQPGQRLIVPFGPRRVTGYLVAVSEASELPAANLKRALAILDPEPLISTTVIALCDWASRYYHHPPGEVFSAAFPRPLREGKEHRPAGVAGWRLTPRGLGLPPGALARSPRQAEALAMMQASESVANSQFASQA